MVTQRAGGRVAARDKGLWAGGDQELAMPAMVPLLCELLTGRLCFDAWRFFVGVLNDGGPLRFLV